MPGKVARYLPTKNFASQHDLTVEKKNASGGLKDLRNQPEAMVEKYYCCT
jgi:hypothetical protein